MLRKRVTKLRCPICKKQVKLADPNSPFCSDRCRTIDLGNWAGGAYVVSSPISDSEEAIREDTPDDSDKDR